MQSLRMKADEFEAAQIKLKEINDLRAEIGLRPIKESKLLHNLIEQAIPRATVDKYGNIVISNVN